MGNRINVKNFEFEESESFKLAIDRINVFGLDRRPKFSYEYLNIKTLEAFCFKHPEFISDEYKAYFELVKQYSSKSVHESRGSHGRKIKSSGANGTLLEYLKSVTGKNFIPEQSMPWFGHFHLTENPKLESQRTKRPVIHFCIAEGTIFVLLYDPYHEIHRTDH